MPKPVCVKCRRFFKPYRNGKPVLEQMPAVSDAEPGTAMEHAWLPYKLWQADLYKCGGCGHEICVGFGRVPFAEHFEDRFGPELARLGGAVVVVNDC